jgi:hypothetical protein
MSMRDVVRGSLQAQVVQPPPMLDSAGRALDGARRSRQRRSYHAAPAAAVALLLVVVGGVAALRAGVTHRTPMPPATVKPTTSTVPTPTPAGVALLDRSELVLLPDTRTISLAQIPGGAIGAYQTKTGWLVTGYGNGTDTMSLWLVLPDGSMHPLVDRADAPVAVSSDGSRLAWRTSGQIKLGRLNTDGTVTVDRSTAAPARGAPLSLSDSAVVLGYTATGGGIDHYDVWLPDRGDYVPTWDKTTSVATVYGPTPDGRMLLGLLRPRNGGKGTCLAQLDPAQDLKAIAIACGLGQRGDAKASVSPDGRWLALQAARDDGSPQVAIVDLNVVFQRPAVTARWDAEGPGVWVDATTMVGTDHFGALLRFHIGQSEPESVTTMVGGVGVAYQLVPRLS